jgi:hypothetical protein
MSLGLVLVALGVWGDHAGWWQEWSFLTNLLASFTAALIGFPIALLVVNRVTTQYRLDSDQRLVRARALRLIHELNSDLAIWCAHPERLASLLDLLRSSYRIPVPQWVVFDAISHWKAAFPIEKLEISPSEYSGVIAETAPNLGRVQILFGELLGLSTSFQAAELEWPDEGRLTDFQVQLAQITSAKFRNDFRLAARELMRLERGGANAGVLSVDDMTRAVGPLAAVITLLRYIADFFETGGPSITTVTRDL